MEAAVAELGRAQHPLAGEAGPLQGPLLGGVVHVGAGLQPLHPGVGEQVGGELALGLGAVAVAAVLGQQGDADVEGPRPRVGAVVDGVVADVAGQGAVLQLDQHVAPVGAEEPVLLEPAPRTIRGARDLLSVALQYGNAFLVGLQAAALKPADHFGNDDVLYLMEDMATGEIRLSILWEWLHKNAPFTANDAPVGVKAGDRFSSELCQRRLAEEHVKLRHAGNRDVHDTSKNTTLPIAREIVETYVMDDVKLPWYIDLLNINLDNYDLTEAQRRIRLRPPRPQQHAAASPGDLERAALP